MISTNHDRKYKSLLYTDSEIPKFKTRMMPTSTNPGSIIGLHLFPQIRIRRLAGKTPYKNMSIIVSCIVNDCNSSPCRLRSSAKILSDLRPNFILSNSQRVAASHKSGPSCISCTCKLPSKGPPGPLEEILGRQEAIFQFHLLLNANFPRHQYRSLKLIQDRVSYPQRLS